MGRLYYDRRMTTTDVSYDVKEAVAEIRAGLKARSDAKRWSVTHGRGTVWGWITIHAAPSRRDRYGAMTEIDRVALAKLLGLDVVHSQGVSVPAQQDYRVEYVDRAHGRTPRRIGVAQWD